MTRFLVAIEFQSGQNCITQNLILRQTIKMMQMIKDHLQGMHMLHYMALLPELYIVILDSQLYSAFHADMA